VEHEVVFAQAGRNYPLELTKLFPFDLEELARSHSGNDSLYSLIAMGGLELSCLSRKIFFSLGRRSSALGEMGTGGLFLFQIRKELPN
jgi:hypothetical protein